MPSRLRTCCGREHTGSVGGTARRQVDADLDAGAQRAALEVFRGEESWACFMQALDRAAHLGVPVRAVYANAVSTPSATARPGTGYSPTIRCSSPDLTMTMPQLAFATSSNARANAVVKSSAGANQYRDALPSSRVRSAASCVLKRAVTD